MIPTSLAVLLNKYSSEATAPERAADTVLPPDMAIIEMVVHELKRVDSVVEHDLTSSIQKRYNQLADGMKERYIRRSIVFEDLLSVVPLASLVMQVEKISDHDIDWDQAAERLAAELHGTNP